MKFPYTALPFDGLTILRPLLKVTIRNGDIACSIWALVDTGADHCACSAEIGESIGLDVKSVVPRKSVQIDGTVLDVYFHRILLEIKGISLLSECGFIYGMDNMVLGHRGFLEHFRATFFYSENWFALKPISKSIWPKIWRKIFPSS